MMVVMNNMEDCLKHILKFGEFNRLIHKTPDIIWQDILTAKELGFISFNFSPYGDVWELNNNIPTEAFLYWCFYTNCYKGYVNDLPVSLLKSYKEIKQHNYIRTFPSLNGEVWSLTSKAKHQINMICKTPSIWNKLMDFIYIHIFKTDFI